MTSRLKKNREFANLIGGLLNRQWGAGLKTLDVNDPAMQAAIRNVQALHGLPQTGLADPATHKAIKEGPPAPVPIQASGTLGAGNTGANLSASMELANPDAAKPGEFTDFSPAMQASAERDPAIARKLREMQLAEGQAQVDRASGRSQHNDSQQSHPTTPPKGVPVGFTDPNTFAPMQAPDVKVPPAPSGPIWAQFPPDLQQRIQGNDAQRARDNHDAFVALQRATWEHANALRTNNGLGPIGADSTALNPPSFDERFNAGMSAPPDVSGAYLANKIVGASDHPPPILAPPAAPPWWRQFQLGQAGPHTNDWLTMAETVLETFHGTPTPRSNAPPSIQQTIDQANELIQSFRGFNQSNSSPGMPQGAVHQ